MRLWNGWGNEDSDLTMELSDGLRALLEALVGPGTALRQATLNEVIAKVPNTIPTTGLLENSPIIYAARKKPIIYPIVGLFNMATPATPDVKKGSPDIPINKYMSILIAPNVLPRINPASNTVNV